MWCAVMGSGNCMEKGQGDGGDNDIETKFEPLPSFAEALCALVSESIHVCSQHY